MHNVPFMIHKGHDANKKENTKIKENIQIMKGSMQTKNENTQHKEKKLH